MMTAEEWNDKPTGSNDGRMQMTEQYISLNTAIAVVEDFCSEEPLLAGHGFSVSLADSLRDAAEENAKAKPEAPAHIMEYTNWRGETARRVIIPMQMWYGSTEWHPKEQWMVTAWCVEKNAKRDFAWQDMKPVQNPATSSAVSKKSKCGHPFCGESCGEE